MMKKHVKQSCWLKSIMSNRIILPFFLFIGIICSSSVARANTSLLYDNADNNTSQSFLPVEQAFTFSGRVEQNSAYIDIEVAPEHYLYKHRFTFRPVSPEISLGIPVYPQGEEIYDPYYQKNLETFPENLTIEIPISYSGQLPEIEIGFQGCAKAGLCYPPHKVSIPLVTKAGTNPDTSIPKQSKNQNFEPEDTFYKNQLEQQLFTALFLFLLAGVGLSFTPCVLPMFPILSSLILGSQQLSRRRVFSLSLTYILSMSLTFAIAGTLMGLFGASLNLQAKLQSVWFIAPMAVLFVILALSMFGLYELQLPSFIRDKLNINNDKEGKISGAITMGIASALVVSPCVSAPLAGALIYISTTGNAIYGGLTLFALGLGMGIPLLLIAVGGRQLLPKAGNWMNNIKAFFGVLLLGVSIWMLERVTPPPVSLFLWGALAIGCAVFLGALNFAPKIRLKAASQAAGLVLLIYGICLIVGAAMGNHNPLKPLELQILSKEFGDSSQQQTLPFTKVISPGEVDRLLANAAQRNQPAMVDLYADWCISCKLMERNVFPDPLVAPELQKLALIKLDITENTTEHQEFLNRYQLFGPPALIFFDTHGKEVKEVRTQGDISASQLKNRLDQFQSNL